MIGRELQTLAASNIRRLRKSKNITQAELARKANISTGYMCDIENSAKWPSADTICRIAGALRLEPFQVFLPTIDSPYFDRQRAIFRYDSILREGYEQSREAALEQLLNTYGPSQTNAIGD